MINLAIVGYGYWGPNLVRNFNSLIDCKVKWVADLRTDRLKKLRELYPDISITQNTDDLFQDNDLDAIVIATPVHLHYPLAKKALESGKHVLLEKPMTQSVEDALDLLAESRKQNKVLMVDHTFLYTGAVQKIKSLIDSGDIGDIEYFDSTRINLGLFQQDINVLWDLAPHDISILSHLIKDKPVSVCATGIAHTPNDIENIAYLTINYASSRIAHISCSWTSPVKVRKILIGGSKKMIMFDDVEPTEKVKIYDTGYKVTNDEDKRKLLIDYRIGDIYVPKLPQQEALSAMANDFVNAIQTDETPTSDWKIGLEVVQVLEAAQKSIKNNGEQVAIKNAF